MKNILIILFIIINLISFGNGFSYSKEEEDSANYLGYKGIISSRDDANEYNLDSGITRREMLKVMMNLSGNQVNENCEGKFKDLNSSDWGCKYAESSLNYNFISPNDFFRPNDKVSKIETLKMVFKALGMKRNDNEDWRIGYIEAGVKEGILDSSFSDYDIAAKRGWIFVLANKIIFNNGDSDLNILDFFLNN